MELDEHTELTIPEILRFTEEFYHEVVSRQTIYNWMDRGRLTKNNHRIFLKYRKGKLRRFCTPEDIRKFWDQEL